MDESETREALDRLSRNVILWLDKYAVGLEETTRVFEKARDAVKSHRLVSKLSSFKFKKQMSNKKCMAKMRGGELKCPKVSIYRWLPGEAGGAGACARYCGFHLKLLENALYETMDVYVTELRKSTQHARLTIGRLRVPQDERSRHALIIRLLPRMMRNSAREAKRAQSNANIDAVRYFMGDPPLTDLLKDDVDKLMKKAKLTNEEQKAIIDNRFAYWLTILIARFGEMANDLAKKLQDKSEDRKKLAADFQHAVSGANAYVTNQLEKANTKVCTQLLKIAGYNACKYYSCKTLSTACGQK